MKKFTVKDRELVTNFLDRLSEGDKTLACAISTLLTAHDDLEERLGNLTRTSPDYENGFDDGLNGKACIARSLEYVNGYQYGKRVATIGLSKRH